MPTRFRCQGQRPVLIGHSHHYAALADMDPSVWETGVDLFPLPHGAPWHPGPPAPPWLSARPGRARRAAGAGLTMHHRALCVLALGTLGRVGEGAQRAWGAERLWGGDIEGWGREAENESRWGGKGSRSDRVLAPHSKPRLREPTPDRKASQMAPRCLGHCLGSVIWGQKSLPRGLLTWRKPGLVLLPSWWLRDPVLVQGQGPKMGSKWAPGRALPSDRSLWTCFGASCLQPAWFHDLLRVKTDLPPGLGACGCFGLGLKGRVGVGRWGQETDRTLAWGVPALASSPSFC